MQGQARMAGRAANKGPGLLSQQPAGLPQQQQRLNEHATAHFMCYQGLTRQRCVQQREAAKENWNIVSPNQAHPSKK